MKTKKPGTVTPEEEAEYYDDALIWDEEVYRKERESTKRWRVVAFIFAGISLFSVIALAGITPLKTVKPYVIKVETTTGIVEVLNPLERGPIKQEEAITKYFIVKYLNARERYDYQRVEEDYQIVGKLSAKEVFTEYKQGFDPANEQSPLNLYGDDTAVTYHVRDVSFLDEDTAIIHIKRNVRKVNELRESYWAITLSFHYVLGPETESDRFINPLGFQVTRYRRDPEIMEEIEVKQ